MIIECKNLVKKYSQDGQELRAVNDVSFSVEEGDFVHYNSFVGNEIKDKELMYLVCCYGDYQSAQRHYDQHIILTMEHTIAQGDPYCSRMLHDTRQDWDLRHPESEFWDKLNNEFPN